jgi:hypothetical protein
MEAGKTLESTCDESSGVEVMECEDSLTTELERPYFVARKWSERESERA